MSSVTRDYLVIGRSEIDAIVKQELADILMSRYSENDKAKQLAAEVAEDAVIEVFRYTSEMIPVIVEHVVHNAWKEREGNLV